MSFLRSFVFGRSKHKKLNEEWGESIKEPLKEGITFHCKYLGSTLVEKASDVNATADAIKAIIAMTKLSNKSLRKVALTIKPTGIVTRDLLHDEEYLDVSIYRISYCSADATYDRVVAFIATNDNETHECHAFLTPKNEVAQACALTIFQAFKVAFEKYQDEKRENKLKNGSELCGMKEKRISEDSSDSRNEIKNVDLISYWED